MARAKRKQEDDIWAYYHSIQLTPEQKAAARAEMKRKGEEAARKGVYKALLDLVGKVHLGLDAEEIRKLREDRD